MSKSPGDEEMRTKTMIGPAGRRKSAAIALDDYDDDDRGGRRRARETHGPTTPRGIECPSRRRSTKRRSDERTRLARLANYSNTPCEAGGESGDEGRVGDVPVSMGSVNARASARCVRIFCGGFGEYREVKKETSVCVLSWGD